MRFIFKSIENYNTLIKKNKLKSNQIQIYSTKKPYFTQFCFSSKSSNLLRGYFDCFSKTKMLIKRTIFCRLSGVDSLETPLSPSWLCFFAHRLIISLYFFFFSLWLVIQLTAKNKYDKNNLWVSNTHQLKSHPRIQNKSTLWGKCPLSEAQPWLSKVITIIRFETYTYEYTVFTYTLDAAYVNLA